MIGHVTSYVESLVPYNVDYRTCTLSFSPNISSHGGWHGFEDVPGLYHNLFWSHPANGQCLLVGATRVVVLL